MEAFVGTWKLKDSDKFSEFMTELGVGFVLKNLAKNASSTQYITLADDVMTIKSVTTFKTTEIKFKLGEEFEEKTGDGRTVKTTMNLEGDKLVQVQPGDKEVKVTREIKDGDYIMTLVCNDVTCTRTYAKQEEKK